MIGTKGVGKVLGRNGGKFQERTSSPREGVAHWRRASTAIFPLSSPTLQPSFANLCHPGWFASLPVLFHQKKCRIPVGGWRPVIPVGHKHFSGWSPTTSFLLIIALLQHHKSAAAVSHSVKSYFSWYCRNVAARGRRGGSQRASCWRVAPPLSAQVAGGGAQPRLQGFHKTHSFHKTVLECLLPAKKVLAMSIKMTNFSNRAGRPRDLPKELEAAAVVKCSPHFLVAANKHFQMKYPKTCSKIAQNIITFQYFKLQTRWLLKYLFFENNKVLGLTTNEWGEGPDLRFEIPVGQFGTIWQISHLFQLWQAQNFPFLDLLQIALGSCVSNNGHWWYSLLGSTEITIVKFESWLLMQANYVWVSRLSWNEAKKKNTAEE